MASRTIANVHSKWSAVWAALSGCVGRHGGALAKTLREIEEEQPGERRGLLRRIRREIALGGSGPRRVGTLQIAGAALLRNA